MSSKFSSPFLKKSPLLGAYTSGADGMVTVSYNDIHQKFQDDLAKNVAKHYKIGTNPCDDPLTTSYNKDGVYKKCPKKNDSNEVVTPPVVVSSGKPNSAGSFEKITGKKIGGNVSKYF